MASRFIKVTATGAIYTGPCYLRSANYGATTVGIAVIRDGSGGTDVLQLNGTSDRWVAGGSGRGVFFGTAIHLQTLTGGSANITVEFEPA